MSESKHSFMKSAGQWACSKCHRWMDVAGKVCDPTKERRRLREIVKRARSNANG